MRNLSNHVSISMNIQKKKIVIIKKMKNRNLNFRILVNHYKANRIRFLFRPATIQS